MKRIAIFYTVVGLLAVMAIHMPLFSQTGEKGDDEDYITYLKANRNALNYNTYGLIEGEQEMVVKVYCGEDSQEAILSALQGFDYDHFQVEKISEDQVIVSVVFRAAPASEPAAPVPAEEEEGQTVETAVEKKKCPRRVEVQVRRVEASPFNEYKYLEGVLQFDMETEVRSEMSGTVKEVAVAAGDRVNEGQLLVRIDSTVLENEIKSIENLIEKWKQLLNQRRNWKERSPRAEKQAEDKIVEAETLLAQRLDDLSKTQFLAPFSGRVASIVAPSAIMERGGSVFTLVSERRLKVRIPEEDAALFSEGLAVKLNLKEREGQVTGRVVKTDVEAKIVVSNDDLFLAPGTPVAYRTLLQAHEDAVVLEAGEVLRDAGVALVYVVNGRVAAARRVVAGPEEGGRILIRSGLEMGEEVIVTGLDCLEDGKKIKIMVWDAEKQKLVKRKKVKGEPVAVAPIKVEEVPPVEVKEIKAKKANFWRLGAGLGFFIGGDAVFTDVYGILNFGGFVTGSFTFRERVEIFFAAAYLPAGGQFTGFDEKVSLTMIPAYLGLKVLLNPVKKFTPFFGAALLRNNTKESYPESDTYEDTSYFSNFGASILGGAYYPLGKKLDLMAQLSYDITKTTLPDTEESLNLGGLRLLVGLSLILGR